MTGTTHLKSLQALHMAIQEGSLKGAADRLGITPAAVGQRIRALEDYLGTDLLLRGCSGLTPTPELDLALADLRLAFEALGRVTETLDFQRVFEIHVVADPDWAELWLAPRLAVFRGAHPNIRFCINGAGDVPVRLGVPDLRIVYGGLAGEPLFTDILVPVTGPDNPRRMADGGTGLRMEGMPLLHLRSHRENSGHPGWVDWFAAFGQRKTGPERGVHYPNARLALEAVRQNVGFLVCGLSLLLQDLETGLIVLPFPISDHLVAPHPYRILTRAEAARRPQVERFTSWLIEEARGTRRRIEALTG
ncbi:MAG: LysR family transcriptional regulator [Gemmobacter sp.]